MIEPFAGFDLSNFWKDSDYAQTEYVEESPSGELIALIEKEIGFRLPASYVTLMKSQNGGIPNSCCFPCKTPTSWSKDHVQITGIMGIGRTKTYSLCGSLGSQFMQVEWGYPDFGICICDCPSAGHDMIMLDYSSCGPVGEPTVVHVDQECDFKVTFLAPNFETFIRGLVNESVYDTSEQDFHDSLARIDTGSFSKLLTELIVASNDPSFERIIRNVCRQLTTVKGYFALHADELSWLVYDLQFYLFTLSRTVTETSYLEVYPRFIALADGDLSTHGYGPGFVENWLKSRIANDEIQQLPDNTLTFSEEYRREFLNRIDHYR